MAGLDVFRKHVHPAHEIFGVRRERLAQQFRIGQHEVRRRNRVGNLFDVKLRLLPCVLVDSCRVFHEFVGPLCGKEVGLFQKIEKLVFRPFRIGEAFVSRIGRHDGWCLLARHALHGASPKIEVGAAEAGLQPDRTLRIGHPVFGNAPDRFDRIGQVFAKFGPYFSFLAGFQVGRERFAAFLDQAGKIARERFDIDVADPGGICGGLIHPFRSPLPRQLARAAIHRKARLRAWFRGSSAERLATGDLAAAILAR